VKLYLHSPNTPSWRGAKLKKTAQEKLYLYLTLLVLCVLEILFPSIISHRSLRLNMPKAVNVGKMDSYSVIPSERIVCMIRFNHIGCARFLISQYYVVCLCSIHLSINTTVSHRILCEFSANVDGCVL
jgi:hypothetical protein